jgi:hypothetical protein
MDETVQTTTKQSKTSLVMASIIGVLALALATTALAPTGTINPGSPTTATMTCVTRSVSASITGGNWRPQTVCNAGEVAMSAGGFCYSAGNMVGSSTTSGTIDRTTWLWCTGSGSAYWYAMCCPQ